MKMEGPQVTMCCTALAVRLVSQQSFTTVVQYVVTAGTEQSGHGAVSTRNIVVWISRGRHSQTYLRPKYSLNKHNRARLTITAMTADIPEVGSPFVTTGLTSCLLVFPTAHTHRSPLLIVGKCGGDFRTFLFIRPTDRPTSTGKIILRYNIIVVIIIIITITI